MKFGCGKARLPRPLHFCGATGGLWTAVSGGPCASFAFASGRTLGSGRFRQRRLAATSTDVRDEFFECVLHNTEKITAIVLVGRQMTRSAARPPANRGWRYVQLGGQLRLRQASPRDC